ncbi:MAG: DUF1697 domain-containing protein [Acidimicrobiales bacterium]
MPTWVALLRAVNLGAHNRVPMPALRKALEASGFEDVRTYVQSGNVVARSSDRTPGQVADRIATLVREEFGVDSPVVVRTAAGLATLVDRNPFPGAALERPKLLHVVFLAASPAADCVDTLHGDEAAREVCRVDGNHLYVDYRDGVHGSKLTPQFFARVLQVDGTARNWRTVLALQEMLR